MSNSGRKDKSEQFTGWRDIHSVTRLPMAAVGLSTKSKNEDQSVNFES